MNDWYQFRVNVPFLGSQFVGWLSTDPARALALAVALKSCPGGAYDLLDKNGTPLATFQFPFHGVR